ncbi:S-layer homology domain-containing protein [Planococcus ruber]|uniref:S-layer homology domain-containing protein n=1 Tax=Planococcus ruber TaxID=2027871 RepID=UPI001FF03537|nr:S-layer homology domain-containing protein [Planococcus ruber]MCJ1908240.1 S-layer homology domain-containing protein [Planococcus ruber]
MAYQPKSYKKFVATAATATLVATAVVPAAFAAEVKPAAFTDVAQQYQAAVDFVVNNNIAKGLNETQFGVSAQIKRGDAAIMIANAAGINDKDAPTSGFSDVPTRGVLAINSLKAAGVVNGKSATNFGFNDSITRGEAAIMLTNAFKLKGNNANVKFTDVNDRYLSAVAALVANDVTNGISATQFGTANNIKRGDFARFLYALEEYIVGEEAPVAANVKALNATEVLVTFNKEVLETSAETIANYEFDAAAPSQQANIVPTDIELQEGGKSVIVRFAPGALVDKTTYDVTVNNVITTDYQIIKDYEESFLFEGDTVAPKLANVSVAGTNLLLTFDEQVNFVANQTVLRVDGTQVSLAGATAVSNDAGSYTYAVPANGLALLNKGTHSLTLVGLEDVAGNEAGTLSTTYNVSDDVTAPTTQSITAVDSDTFKVTFSEAVTAPTLKVLKGSTEYTTDVTVVPGTGNTQYYVTVDTETGFEGNTPLNPLYSANQSSVNLSVTVSNYRDAVTLVGNPFTGNVTLTRDTTAPALLNNSLNTVETVTANEVSSTVITVPFNELVALNGAPTVRVTTPAGVEVVASGVRVVQGPTATTSAVELTIAGAAQAGTYSIAFPANALRDAEANYNAALTATAVSEAPARYQTLAAGSVSVPSNNVISVNYGEEVTDSALTVSNYTLDNAPLPAGTVAVFAGSKNVVELRLPSTFTVVDDAAYKFEISQNVKTAQGETIVANAAATPKANYTQNITLRDNVAPRLVSARYAVQAQGDATTNRIELTFSEGVTLNTANNVTDDFSVLVNGTAIAVTGATVDGDNVILTTAAPINAIQAATVSIVPQNADTNPLVAITDDSISRNAAAAGTVSVSGSAVIPASQQN